MGATTEFDVAALTPVHWIGVVAAFVSAAVHLVLGIGFLPHWMGAAFLVATAGFLAGIWLVVTGRQRRRVYLLGVPFTAGQIGFWYLANRPGSLDALGPAEIVDKVAQVVLVIVLVVLYLRDA
mgnify:CR=1 FL=1